VADALLAWCAGVFAICGATLVAAGLHAAGSALLGAAIACTAAVWGGQGRWWP
jgi:hypothetical protein